MRKCFSSSNLHSLLCAGDQRKQGDLNACSAADTRVNGGLGPAHESNSPFTYSAPSKGLDRSLQEAKSSHRSSMGRQDSAHEGPCSPLPWNLHSARKQEKTCRDSASSFDRTSAQLGDKMGSTEGCVSDGNLSQHSEGSQCDMDVFTSMRRFKPHARPHRAASLPECLRYPPGQRAAQHQQSSLQREDSAAAPPRRSFSSEDSSEMDVDCCGDSGAIIVKAPARSRQPACRSTAYPMSSRAYSLNCVPLPRLSSSDEDDEGAEAGSMNMRELSRWHSSSCISEGQAAVELFFRLNHARQTVDYVRRQAARYAQLDRAEMGIWEALELLGNLREYETALMEEEGTDADMPLTEHAMMTAEACRAAFPDLDWLHLVGLIHSLGKLLAHKRIGGEPQWAVCGESFPVGCRFHPSIACSAFFSVNPDRRRRIYNTPTGIYREGCGLAAVHMSWSASEYLYMVLLLNKTRLPAEALFLIRHQRFHALNRAGTPYDELLSASDRLMVPWLARFKELSAYKRKPNPPAGRLTGDAFREYYSGLIAKYIPQGTLRW
ncbi:probable inositol oxygenase 1 at C-terminar half [Coccomyxa sp. Obi]|nr:probable inositol oxygenase 1 at C-terminar half [Coccomyxa sp. Obi]